MRDGDVRREETGVIGKRLIEVRSQLSAAYRHDVRISHFKQALIPACYAESARLHAAKRHARVRGRND